jgi:F-box-like
MGRSHLPVELIVGILGYLHFKDLVICSGVSRQFRAIIDKSPCLEYILELGLCGLVDSALGTLTTAERLFRLRQREASWSALQWQSAPKIPLKQKYIFWELGGGLFVGTYRSPPGLIPMPSLRHRRAFNTIDICGLGTYDIAKAGPKQMPLEKLFYDFAIDPGQDLLILLEVPPPMQYVCLYPT